MSVFLGLKFLRAHFANMKHIPVNFGKQICYLVPVQDFDRPAFHEESTDCLHAGIKFNVPSLLADFFKFKGSFFEIRQFNNRKGHVFCH